MRNGGLFILVWTVDVINEIPKGLRVKTKTFVKAGGPNPSSEAGFTQCDK
jgi:hypothetical protein